MLLFPAGKGPEAGAEPGREGVDDVEGFPAVPDVPEGGAARGAGGVVVDRGDPVVGRSRHQGGLPAPRVSGDGDAVRIDEGKALQEIDASVITPCPRGQGAELPAGVQIVEPAAPPGLVGNPPVAQVLGHFRPVEHDQGKAALHHPSGNLVGYVPPAPVPVDDCRERAPFSREEDPHVEAEGTFPAMAVDAVRPEVRPAGQSPGTAVAERLRLDPVRGRGHASVFHLDDHVPPGARTGRPLLLCRNPVAAGKNERVGQFPLVQDWLGWIAVSGILRRHSDPRKTVIPLLSSAKRSRFHGSRKTASR